MGHKQLGAIERWNLLLAGVLVLATALLASSRFALGSALGAMLSAANFYGMHKLLEAAMRAQGRRKLIFGLLLCAKMGVLIALVFVALRFVPLSPVGLALGLSVFLVSIMIESLRFAVGQKAAGE